MPYLQDLIRRFICFRNITAGVQIITSIFIIILGVIIFKFMNKWKKSDNYGSEYDDDSYLYLGYILSVGMIALGITLIIGNIIGIAKNMCMPELVAIEYLKSMQ